MAQLSDAHRQQASKIKDWRGLSAFLNERLDHKHLEHVPVKHLRPADKKLEQAMLDFLIDVANDPGALDVDRHIEAGVLVEAQEEDDDDEEAHKLYIRLGKYKSPADGQQHLEIYKDAFPGDLAWATASSRHAARAKRNFALAYFGTTAVDVFDRLVPDARENSTRVTNFTALESEHAIDWHVYEIVPWRTSGMSALDVRASLKAQNKEVCLINLAPDDSTLNVATGGDVHRHVVPPEIQDIIDEALAMYPEPALIPLSQRRRNELDEHVEFMLDELERRQGVNKRSDRITDPGPQQSVPVKERRDKAFSSAFRAKLKATMTPLEVLEDGSTPLISIMKDETAEEIGSDDLTFFSTEAGAGPRAYVYGWRQVLPDFVFMAFADLWVALVHRLYILCAPSFFLLGGLGMLMTAGDRCRHHLLVAMASSGASPRGPCRLARGVLRTNAPALQHED